MKKVENQYQNFQKALRKLQEFVSAPITQEREEAGVIQAFEFTFEQCWKYFQKKAQEQGEIVPGPKLSLEIAMRYDWIHSSDESHWLQMLVDRNLSSHTYKEEVAHAVFTRIVSCYLKLFASVK